MSGNFRRKLKGFHIYSSSLDTNKTGSWDFSQPLNMSSSEPRARSRSYVSSNMVSSQSRSPTAYSSVRQHIECFGGVHPVSRTLGFLFLTELLPDDLTSSPVFQSTGCKDHVHALTEAQLINMYLHVFYIHSAWETMCPSKSPSQSTEPSLRR